MYLTEYTYDIAFGFYKNAVSNNERFLLKYKSASVINKIMKKSLAATNPYFRNQALKKEMVRRFVASSSAIEGIHINHYKKRALPKKTVRRAEIKTFSRKAKSSSRFI